MNGGASQIDTCDMKPGRRIAAVDMAGQVQVAASP
jgi:hypothetical protein